MQEQIRDIRKRLRLAMNGVISTSMREKGMNYKLIFGVPFPELKQIAQDYKEQASADLAEALWKEDVRELKILATMLYPYEQFTHAKVEEWVSAIPYMEIAEQLARNLLCKIEEPDEVAAHLLYNREDIYARTVAFLIFVNLFVSNQQIASAHFNLFWVEAVRTLACDSFGATWFEKQAALNALKWYGRQSEEKARQVLVEFARMEQSDIPEQQEFYNDLKFEFEYCH
ncbi:MAG: DNA alkylation repair protein [Parabacteroides sp.]|nr:DNA alkylation repair protein [Parabacteroides sp.]